MTEGTMRPLLRYLRRLGGAPDLASLTDAQLLERFQAHAEEAAFEVIVRRHAGLVLAACGGLLTDEADVEDAFQATFLVLLRKAGSTQSRRALGCWLSPVARRVAAQAAARRRRQARPSLAEPGVPAPDPSWREACDILRRELDRLPEKYRLPLLL